MTRNPPPYDATPADPTAVVAPHLPRPPRWLVVAGLGDGIEAQCAARRWPGVRCVGVDPDPRAVYWQTAHGFTGHLWRVGLSVRAGHARLFLDELNCPSMFPANVDAAPPGKVVLAPTVTLDDLDRKFGPFDDALLWLDVEGWEYMALAGGHGLLDSGRVLGVNWERRMENEELSGRHAAALLRRYDFAPVLTWGRQWWGHDELWVRGVA